MRLNKDEALILWKAIKEQKYELNERVKDYATKNRISSMKAFESLEKKLDNFSRDKRREGRTSMNSFDDGIKRFVVRESLQK